MNFDDLVHFDFLSTQQLNAALYMFDILYSKFNADIEDLINRNGGEFFFKLRLKTENGKPLLYLQYQRLTENEMDTFPSIKRKITCAKILE